MKKPLSFKNGMTNNPSDLVCSDDCLAVEIGAEWNGNAHKAIQYPKEVDSNFLNDIAIIHDFANYTHIISVHDTKLWWCDFDVNGYASTGEMRQIAAFDSSVISAETIGNTVILNTKDGLLYLLWKSNDPESEDYGYKVLGGQLPEINVTFNNITHRYDYFIPTGTSSDEDDTDYHVGISDYVTMNYEDKPGDAGHYPTITSFTDESAFKNVAIGLIEKCIAKVHRENLFVFPYWARAAYRLYDGSHVMITNPVLILPTVRYNRRLILYAIGMLEYEPFAGQLWARIDNDLSDWSDIIQGVDIFVSNEVRTFDEEGTYTTHSMADSATFVIADMANPQTNPMSASSPPQYTPHTEQYTSIAAPEQKSDQTIINDLLASSVFYQVAQLEDGDYNQWLNISEKMPKNTVQNLTTQIQLEHDDFFGHTTMMPEQMLAYNGRLHLAGITRGFFDGFPHFISLRPSTRTVDYYVEIQAQDGTRIVHGQAADDALAYWFYYPDPRAKHVYFIINNNKYKLPLKQHPFLNGAYYFSTLPSSNADNLPTAEQDSTAPETSDDPELLANQVITSEVNNPFVYNVDGANDVGSGKIMGLVTNTQALSEGQFGQHPLIAFTDEGIWALTTNSEGLYNSVIPLSREVCCNPNTITQTDNAIFFATEKGLMILVGSKVQCVSELLDGKDADIEPFLESGEDYLTTPFRDVLQNGKIAYDYKNKRLWIYHESNIWTFNIASKTFAQVHSTDPWVGHSILYPDCIVQTYAGKLLSLLKTDNINDDLNEYDARLITRPIKFGDALTYKTIFRMQHLWLGDGTFTTRLWGSDDLKNWSRLISLHGRPWRYYTFRLDFSGMKATDAYHGLVAELQPRHTNRLHTEPEPE